MCARSRADRRSATHLFLCNVQQALFHRSCGHRLLLRGALAHAQHEGPDGVEERVVELCPGAGQLGLVLALRLALLGQVDDKLGQRLVVDADVVVQLDHDLAHESQFREFVHGAQPNGLQLLGFVVFASTRATT